MAVAYRPVLDTSREIVLAVLPWLVLLGLVAAWSGRSIAPRLAGMGIAVAAWSSLIFNDDRWSLLTFGLYGLSFIVDSTRPRIGVTLAGVVTAVWTLASLGGPTWTVVIPVLVFGAASTIAFALHRIGRLTARQAALISELQATRDELATSERSRGALEERTRMAGEIHDTLAQGFASIVLLARVGRKATTHRDTLESIETAAQENLDTARRLVESTQPGELREVSLPDALRRHLRDSRPDNIDGDLEILGPPRPLPGSVETLVLRAAQEGLRNAYTHAQATRIGLTLSYLDDAVTLDVSDDGVGFVDGQVSDRGSLTGGQGLATLARRVETLSGHLTVDRSVGGGSVLTVRFPTP